MKKTIIVIVFLLFTMFATGCDDLSTITAPVTKYAMNEPTTNIVPLNISTPEASQPAIEADKEVPEISEVPEIPEMPQPPQPVKETYLPEGAKAIRKGDTERPVVYLTFDGGQPTEPVDDFLDILEANEVKATFFITGNYFSRDALKESILRMVEEGHSVGNHTATHPSLPRLSPQEIEEEINFVGLNFRQLTGQDMTLLRPPYGDYSDQTLAIANELGYKTILWSVDYRDWQTLKGGPEEAYTHVMEHLHNGAIILMHLNSKDSLAALDKIIKELKLRGFQMEAL
ncbi:polysaccharide deacetylase family protein [Desulforamulus aquiferis]|uniref:Polysaccharide deacetylase family protein n=1 Tax=Desulforamulus aquiferis TaxID=1397668 RepID=A0AAW7ZD86_9FIRM|nr:polysaccharide deacetylase family protein [Desulforamulus aquiferis]MDO7787682.1 polysaccharide deacetylase family protein [Desulforamulus aquiferis]RYD05938.1 hypothetical protein N752_06750 [Desulforamulus aquiferis]